MCIDVTHRRARACVYVCVCVEYAVECMCRRLCVVCADKLVKEDEEETKVELPDDDDDDDLSPDGVIEEDFEQEFGAAELVSILSTDRLAHSATHAAFTPSTTQCCILM